MKRTNSDYKYLPHHTFPSWQFYAADTKAGYHILLLVPSQYLTCFSLAFINCQVIYQLKVIDPFLLGQSCYQAAESAPLFVGERSGSFQFETLDCLSHQSPKVITITLPWPWQLCQTPYYHKICQKGVYIHFRITDGNIK